LVTVGKIDTKVYLDNLFQTPLFEGLNLSADIYINYWLEHDKHVNTEMLALIQKLNIPVYLGTNQDEYRTMHIKELVGQYFQDCFSSYRIGYLKPSSLFYAHIERH
jgi:FMN phosphatase YigB (HAD superfamily)